jgi:23S rRNA (adenine2030-N6)-methyltransferase
MLSYRHAFHAGNHADVLKHLVLVRLIRDLTRKDKPLLFVDTHAGAGSYSLEHGYAMQNAEFKSGVARLWNGGDVPAIVDDYVRAVKAVNPDGVLRVYPGSPQLALQLTRPQDRLLLYELHRSDSKALQEHLRDAGRRVSIVVADGFSGLRAALPPPSRRGLVLIDPSFEVKTDYRSVVAAVRDALERFATGTYAVWYPRLKRREAEALPDRLRRAANGDWLDVWLDVKAPADIGMHGSGMFVFNPSWKLETELRRAMPTLVAALGQDEQAAFGLTFRQT